MAPAAGQKSTILVQPLALALNILPPQVNRIATFASIVADHLYLLPKRPLQPERRPAPLLRGRELVVMVMGHALMDLTVGVGVLLYSKAQASLAKVLHAHKQQLPTL